MPNRRTNGNKREPAVEAPVAEPPPPREIMMEARDYRFDPSEIIVEPGQHVRLTLVNNGTEAHSIEFDLPSGEVELRRPLAAGDSGQLEFDAPPRGHFSFYCPIGNHLDKGMEGMLIVKGKES